MVYLLLLFEFFVGYMCCYVANRIRKKDGVIKITYIKGDSTPYLHVDLDTHPSNWKHGDVLRFTVDEPNVVESESAQ